MTNKCSKCGKFTNGDKTCLKCLSEPLEQKMNLNKGSMENYQGKIKFPQFPADDMTSWWPQVKTQLALAKLSTEKARYQYVVAALTMEVACCVPDLVCKEPDSSPYTMLKDCILA
jgi:hypothetical protein